MADIDQIIAGGAGASTRADFSGLGNLLDSFYKGRDEAAKNDLRTAFKNGVPTTADGSPDFSAMAKTLFQKGGLDQGVAASNLGIQRDQLRAGQRAAEGMGRLESGQPIVGPSTSRNSVTIDPSKRADISPQEPQAAPQGGATVMKVLAAQGIPNDQLGAASASVARQLGVNPTDTIDTNDPRIRGVIVPAVQQLKRMGIGQVAQPGQPQQQDIPPVNPQQNQGTFGAPPATPTRGAVPTGNDPEIQKQIAVYTAIASNPAYPKSVQEAAQTRLKALQSQIEPTGPMKEYDLYRRQGGNLPFNDWLADLESGKAGATEQAKANVKEQQEYIDSGKQASSRLTTLNTMSNIIRSDPNINLGFGGPTALKVKMALESLGVPVPDLSGPQAVQKLNASLASEMAKSLTSRTTQFEFRTFLGNNPGLELDKSGNERLIGIFSQLAKREVDLGRLARQNRDNWSNWDNVVENYDKQHPMRDPVTNKVLSTDSVIAPGKASTPAGLRVFNSPSEVHAAGLPSGTRFRDNKGVERIVP